jgi:toxin ParE1/3/4
VKVVWTDQALIRLGEIETFIAVDSPTRASSFVEKLIQRGERLGKFPRLGRPLPELKTTVIREIIVDSYRIVYKTWPESVHILTVFEGHRLLRSDDLE